MPLHDLGYRSWQGRLRSGNKWWVIAETGVRLAWKSNWLKRMLLVAWLPAVYLGFLLFVYERSLTDPRSRAIAPGILAQLPNAGPVVREMILNPEAARHDVWSFILLTLFRYPQGVLMVMLVGLIAPSLIARDIRSRAFLLYFSRPLERVDYVLGKSVVVWVFLALITTVPALALYVLGVFLSPDLSVLAHTWDLPLRILAASIWLIVPTTTIALCFSSLTVESRYASFAWFSIWVLGWVAYVNLSVMDARRTNNFDAVMDSRWTLVSLYHSLGRIQTWVFGLETDHTRVIIPIVLLILATGVAFAVLLHRVSAPLRI